MMNLSTRPPTPGSIPGQQPATNLPGSARSNLRHIQTVDDHRTGSNPRHHGSHVTSGHQFYTGNPHPVSTRPPFVVSHKPAPSLTQIRTVDNNYQQQQQQQNSNSNLRSIPTVASSGGGPGSNPSAGGPKITKTGGSSSRVMISNLPGTMNFARISAMTTACGNVKNINMQTENGTAVVEFANPSGAENFIRANNRKIIDRSMISVARLA